MQRAKHHAVDAAWTRATINGVTQERLPAVPIISVSRFWDRVQRRGAPEVREALYDEATEFQRRVEDLASDRKRANFRSEIKQATVCNASKPVGIAGRFSKAE
jgi:hypothetical protein